MKKLILLLVCSLITFSQGLSIYAGLNIAAPSSSGDQSQFTGLPVEDKKSNFAVGLAYDIDLYIVYLHTGAAYTKSSFVGPFKTENISSYATIDFTQLEIPIFLKMHVFPWVIKPYIFGGLMYQQVLKAEYEFVGSSGKLDAKDFVQGSFMPFAVGVGIDLDLPILPIMMVEGRIITSKDYDKNKEYGSFNQVQILVGLRF